MQELEVGDFVKVRLMNGKTSEQVWCELLEIKLNGLSNTDSPTYSASLKVRIDNHCISPAFLYGEILEVPDRFVLDVLKKQAK